MKLLDFYHRMPYPGRCATASARGFYLNWWRYGPHTDHAVAEALARECWTDAQWRSWKEGELARLLHRAERHVPWYREHWTSRRRLGDRRSSEILANWPIVDKEELRSNPKAFLADDCSPSRMFHIHTSGTTGKPVHIFQSRRTVQRQYALMEARWRNWYGLSRNDRWAIIGGQLVAPVRATRPPYWVWNAGLRQLYLSSVHLSPDSVLHYRSALIKHRVRYLWGYSSGLHALAEGLLAQNVAVPAIEAIITNAEPLLAHQRSAIETAFQCPVFETYGMSEAVLSASQCHHGSMHLWPESGIVEVVENDVETAAGQPGEFLATGLNNVDMPLIRYRTGDRGALAVDRSVCACGRTLPRLASIEGRNDDVLLSPSGRRVGRLDPVFKADLPIREAQIIQDGPASLRVLCVPTPAWGSTAERDVARGIRDRMGDVEITFELVSAIPRTANGKFRAVISQLTAEQKRSLTMHGGSLSRGDRDV